MSVYPPLTQDQILQINTHMGQIDKMVRDLESIYIPMFLSNDQDVDHMQLLIGPIRNQLAKLDLKLFQTWGLVNRLRNSNGPNTELPNPKPKSLTVDQALDQLL